MSDWGKFLLWVLEKMPWVVLLALAAFVLTPDEWIPDYALAFRQEWRAEALWASIPIALITCLWIFERWQAKKEQQQKKDAETQMEEDLERHELENFSRMTSRQRSILMTLYNELGMSTMVKENDRDIQALVMEGYLESGVPESDRFGELVVRVRLFRRAREVIALALQARS